MSTKTLSSNPYIEGLTGVVDPECRLFGCDNLYIAGSSLFPTSGAVNPTNVIMSVTLRGAEHMAKNFSTIAG